VPTVATSALSSLLREYADADIVDAPALCASICAPAPIMFAPKIHAAIKPQILEQKFRLPFFMLH
jgi:hypothetical protein